MISYHTLPTFNGQARQARQARLALDEDEEDTLRRKTEGLIPFGLRRRWRLMARTDLSRRRVIVIVTNCVV